MAQQLSEQSDEKGSGSESESEELSRGATQLKRRLIICCDGTSQKPYVTSKEANVSNVVRIALAISPIADGGRIVQTVKYNWGLGAWDHSVRELAFGARIDDVIMDLYRFVVHNWAEGCELIFVGFSRGAFTMLSLADMLDKIGLVAKHKVKRNAIGYAYHLHKKRPKDGKLKPQFRKDKHGNWMNYSDALAQFKRHKHCRAVHIKCLALFDTVCAVANMNQLKLPGVPGNVGQVFHACSLDDLRYDFTPQLLKRDKGSGKLKPNVTEVWFAGDHMDIGGGHDEAKQSNAVGIWMKDKLKTFVHFNEEYVHKWANEKEPDEIHDETEWSGGSLATKAAAVFYVWLRPWGFRQVPTDAVIHGSVLERFSDDKLYAKRHNPFVWRNADGSVQRFFEEKKEEFNLSKDPTDSVLGQSSWHRWGTAPVTSFLRIFLILLQWLLAVARYFFPVLNKQL